MLSQYQMPETTLELGNYRTCGILDNNKKQILIN